MEYSILILLFITKDITGPDRQHLSSEPKSALKLGFEMAPEASVWVPSETHPRDNDRLHLAIQQSSPANRRTLQFEYLDDGVTVCPVLAQVLPVAVLREPVLAKIVPEGVQRNCTWNACSGNQIP